MIGIIFAMKEELDELKKYINDIKITKIYDLEFIEGVVSGKRCILVECGIGKVNAARCTQVLIDKFDVDYVFNIGVAGGVSNGLNVGDIVAGSKLVQHDFDITAFNHDKGYIPNTGVFINSDDYLLSLVKNDSDVKCGVIASGDIFCTEDIMSLKICDKFNALCVEMEGAAIAQVCYLCNIPFLVLRSISDVVGKDNKITYDNFLLESSKKIAEKMVSVINKIN